MAVSRDELKRIFLNFLLKYDPAILSLLKYDKKIHYLVVNDPDYDNFLKVESSKIFSAVAKHPATIHHLEKRIGDLNERCERKILEIKNKICSIEVEIQGTILEIRYTDIGEEICRIEREMSRIEKSSANYKKLYKVKNLLSKIISLSEEFRIQQKMIIEEIVGKILEVIYKFVFEVGEKIDATQENIMCALEERFTEKRYVLIEKTEERKLHKLIENTFYEYTNNDIKRLEERLHELIPSISSEYNEDDIKKIEEILGKLIVDIFYDYSEQRRVEERLRELLLSVFPRYTEDDREVKKIEERLQKIMPSIFPEYNEKDIEEIEERLRELMPSIFPEYNEKDIEEIEERLRELMPSIFPEYTEKDIEKIEEKLRGLIPTIFPEYTKKDIRGIEERLRELMPSIFPGFYITFRLPVGNKIDENVDYRSGHLDMYIEDTSSERELLITLSLADTELIKCLTEVLQDYETKIVNIKRGQRLDNNFIKEFIGEQVIRNYKSLIGLKGKETGSIEKRIINDIIFTIVYDQDFYKEFTQEQRVLKIKTLTSHLHKEYDSAIPPKKALYPLWQRARDPKVIKAIKEDDWPRDPDGTSTRLDTKARDILYFYYRLGAFETKEEMMKFVKQNFPAVFNAIGNSKKNFNQMLSTVVEQYFKIEHGIDVKSYGENWRKNIEERWFFRYIWNRKPELIYYIWKWEGKLVEESRSSDGSDADMPSDQDEERIPDLVDAIPMGLYHAPIEMEEEEQDSEEESSDDLIQYAGLQEIETYIKRCIQRIGERKVRNRQRTRVESGLHMYALTAHLMQRTESDIVEETGESSSNISRMLTGTPENNHKGDLYWFFQYLFDEFSQAGYDVQREISEIKNRIFNWRISSRGINFLKQMLEEIDKEYEITNTIQGSGVKSSYDVGSDGEYFKRYIQGIGGLYNDKVYERLYTLTHWILGKQEKSIAKELNVSESTIDIWLHGDQGLHGDQELNSEGLIRQFNRRLLDDNAILHRYNRWIQKPRQVRKCLEQILKEVNDE